MRPSANRGISATMNVKRDGKGDSRFNRGPSANAGSAVALPAFMLPIAPRFNEAQRESRDQLASSTTSTRSGRLHLSPARIAGSAVCEALDRASDTLAFEATAESPG